MTRADFLTVDEIANILRISKNTLHRKAWREKSGCPLRKIGKLLLSHKKDFEDWSRGLNG